MARPRRTGQTADPITRAGGVGTYNDVYVKNGSNARAARMAREAIKRQFPEAAQDTIDAIERRARNAREGAKKVRDNSDTYRLPADRHQEIPGPPGRPGERRTWTYYYLVTVGFEVVMGGQVVSRGTINFEASGQQPLTRDEILEQARSLMAVQTGLWDVAYEFQRRGASVNITSLTIIQATRQLRPAENPSEG